MEGIHSVYHKPVSQTKCDVALRGIEQSPVTEPLAGLPLNNGGTIVVRGFQYPISKEMMELYFTSSLTSGGGDITDMVIDVMTTKEVFIVFADNKVAARVAERPHHRIVGQDVEVQLVPQPVVTTSEHPPLDVMNTVLVKGLSTIHNESVLKLYFTNKKKSGGGDVTNISIKDTSAYVSFIDPKVAARVAEKKFHKIVGSTVEVELVAPAGPIESVSSDDPNSYDNYDNILILDNVPQTVQDEVLLLYIDSMTELDGEDGDYTIDRNNTEVVVTFKPDNIPPAGLGDTIFKISSTPLGDKVHIQARRPVSLANSVLIQNIPTQRCTEDWLEMYFTNKTKSGIESYKEIEIVDHGTVIIHLSNRDDMEIILSQNHSRLGDGVVVMQCTSQSTMFRANPPVATTQSGFVINVSKQFVNCIKKNQGTLGEMLAPFFATVSVDTEMDQLKISPCPGCENLGDWKTRCESITGSYLKFLVSETVSFPTEIKAVMYPIIINCMQSHTLVDIKFDEENLTVVISGEKPMVYEIKDELKEACELETSKQEASIEESKFLPFLKSKVNSMFSKFKPISENRSSFFTGVKPTQEDSEKDIVLSSIAVRISNDIVQFLYTTRGRSLLQSYLQGFESLVKVQFDPKGTLRLLSSEKSDSITVARKIEEHVASISVPFSNPEIFLPSLKGYDWAILRSNLEETHCVSISISSSGLIILGDKGSLTAVRENIEQFIENNCNAERSISFCGAQWRLLTTHMASKWNKIEHRLENERMVNFMVPKANNKISCIFLKGEKALVTGFAKEIDQLITSISTSPPIEQARPGTVKFFYSEKGTTLIRGIEAEEKSCIQLNVLQGKSENVAKPKIAKKGTRLCMGTTKEGIAIVLMQGNISDIPVDVMVNITNGDLKQISGVSLAIGNKSGSNIQEESNCTILMAGKWKIGDAIISKEVGKLPCKRLIYAVGPNWNGGQYNEEVLLKKACLESLGLASNFQTVSFPAMSIGLFGFPVKKCASCMVNAFLEYSTGNMFTVLREITIVIHDQSAICAFTQEMSQNLDDFKSTAPSAAGVSLENIQKTSTKPTVVDHDIIAQFIQLHKGELLKQKADVYVNTVGGNFDLSQGAVSASLLKAGGKALQDECTAFVTKNGKIPVGGVVVTGPGSIRCKKIIHTVGPVYDGKRSAQVLQYLVLKCLETCDSLKASTIAFPALGAGNLNYPQNVVADIMVNAIAYYLKTNIASTCIKSVSLVIYMDNAYAEFNSVLLKLLGNVKPFTPEIKWTDKSKPPQYNSAAPEPLMAGPVKVEIAEGDITEDRSDAIVNTTNETMQLVGSGVAGAILQKGGPEMQKMCNTIVSKGFRLKEGKVCDTPSVGHLKCKHVFHITYNQRQSLGKAVDACLKRAEKLHLNSISFPAIGTGIEGMNSDEAANSICISIISFGHTNPKHVRQVRIIVLQTPLCKLFENKFIELVNKPGLFQRLTSRVSSWFNTEESVSGSCHVVSAQSQEKSPYENSVLHIQIYAEDLDKVTKTKDRLQRMIDDQFTSDQLTDDVISRLSSKQKNYFKGIAEQKHIEITFKASKDSNCIQLRGDRNDVADLKFEIQTQLNHIRAFESIQREAKLLQDKVKWQWLSNTHEYEDYDALTNYRIEQAYQNDSNMTFVDKTDQDYEQFDFKKMVANDGHSVYNIQRLDLEDLLKESEFPSNWTKMAENTSCVLVSLDPSNQEYVYVKSRLEHSLKQVSATATQPGSRAGQYQRIIKIERVQNTVLYAQFVARKKSMDQKNSADAVNELELFHGCPRDVAVKICYQGFNRSFAGRNATFFGKGVYFAWNASYSANDYYSPRDAHGCKYIMLARVLTGEFTTGNPNYITPPPKSTNGLDLYDSVVDKVDNPSIFVIFTDAQAYPDYLITLF